MPIKDLQPSEPRLSRLGVIRLGEKRVSKRTGKQYPVELPYFSFVDAPDLLEVFGPECTRLPFYFPYPETDRNFVAFHELWQGGVLYCRGDGERIIRRIDREQGEVVVRDGAVIRAYVEEGEEQDVRGSVPCPGLKHDRWRHCADCRPSALLKIMVRDPERPNQLVGDRLGWYQIRTGSLLNIQDLTGQMMFIEQIALSSGKNWLAIPLLLDRVSREIAVNVLDQGTGRHRRIVQRRYFLSMSVDPLWVQAVMQRLSGRALIIQPISELPLLNVIENVVDEAAYSDKDKLGTHDLPSGDCSDSMSVGPRDLLPDIEAMKANVPVDWDQFAKALAEILPDYSHTEIMGRVTERFTGVPPIGIAEAWSTALDIVAERIAAANR